MATTRQSTPESDRPALREDELVRLTAAAGAHGTYVLTGWLGKSPEAGFWRLYPTPELDEYIEIAENDIVFTQPFNHAVAPLGGTAIVIKASAQLRGVSTDAAEARAAFLQGDITHNTIAASQMNATALSIGPLGNKDYTKGFWCNVSMFFACATHVVEDQVCTLSSGKLCGTRRFLP
jgi:hypothetical protein